MNKWRLVHYRDTLRHKAWLIWYVLKACGALFGRAVVHDLSKFSSIETRGFVGALPLLKNAHTYGSPEYEVVLAALKPATQHHNKVNSHHPEYFGNVIHMSPLDQLEMLCDWKASAKSRGEEVRVDVNKKRFSISDEMLAGFLRDIGEIGL